MKINPALNSYLIKKNQKVSQFSDKLNAFMESLT